MKNKILISTLIIMLLTLVLSFNAFATNNAMDSMRNAATNFGDAIGNTATKAKDTIVNGTQNLANDAKNLGNNMMNGTNNDTMNTTNNGNTWGTTNNGDNNNNNDDYTATRTATDGTGLFGMNNNVSTWVILGIVGAVIVGLVWYYGSQYENRDYNND